MAIKTRLLYLLISWLAAGLVYIGASFTGGNAWLVPESPVEQLIPFSASGIWLYLLFYVYIPYTFLTAEQSKIQPMTAAFILTACVSGLVFVFFPTSIRFPDFEPNGIASRLLHFVSMHDTEQNCFPSMHASLITLCTLANWNVTQKARSYGVVLLTVLMYYSILQVRRHVFIDLAAGILLAVLAWQFSTRIYPRMSAKKGNGYG